MKTAFQFAVTPQLDKDDLVEGQTYKIKGLVNRSPATFINISHFECVDRWRCKLPDVVRVIKVRDLTRAEVPAVGSQP